jgi:hypothetical protein
MDRAKQRSKLTDKDWSLIFDELMRRNLIDVPDDYNNEARFFNDANQLESIFQIQEESNLFIIHRL